MSTRPGRRPREGARATVRVELRVTEAEHAALSAAARAEQSTLADFCRLAALDRADLDDTDVRALLRQAGRGVVQALRLLDGR